MTVKRFQFSFDAKLRATGEARRVSALRSGNTKAEALAHLQADYEDITNLTVEELP